MTTSREQLLVEKERLVAELDRISIPTERGQRMPKMPDYGEELGENASEVEEYSNRMTLVKELSSALTRVEDKLAELAA